MIWFFFLSWLYQIFVAADSFVSSADIFVSADGFVPGADEATVASGASYFSNWLRRTSVVTHPRVVPLRCAGSSFRSVPLGWLLWTCAYVTT